MAIRLLEYTVTTDAITNASTQYIGTQGDKNVTKLVFILDDKLIESLKSYSDNGKFYYRFDGYDGAGGLSSTEPIEFDPSTTKSFSYSIENWQTKHGGTIQTFFIITYIEDNATELELHAYSVKMKLKPKPDAKFIGGENYESITALAVSTKYNATVAKYASATAVDAMERTENARAALENGTVWIFDGGDSESEADVKFVVDGAMSSTSNNAVANKVIKAYVDNAKNEMALADSDLKKYVDDRSGFYIYEQGFEWLDEEETHGWRYKKYIDKEGNKYCECSAVFTGLTAAKDSNQTKSIYNRIWLPFELSGVHCRYTLIDALSGESLGYKIKKHFLYSFNKEIITIAIYTEDAYDTLEGIGISIEAEGWLSNE